MHLLTGHAQEGWQEFYSIKFELIPNLALDIIGSFFVNLGLSPEVALRIFSAISVLLVAAGTYAISISLNKQPPWLAMWAFIFIFNRYFIWGFLNYFFSLGLGFLIFAFWIAMQKSPKKHIQLIGKLAVSLLLLAPLLSHLMGYGISLICIFFYEFGKVFSIQKNWKKISHYLSNVALVFLPSILFYFLFCVHGESGGIFYYDQLYIKKIKSLVSPFLSYNALVMALVFFSFVATLIIALRKYYQSFSDYKKFIADIYPGFVFLIPSIIFIIFLIVPSEILRSSYIDKRLFIVIILLAVALLTVKLNSRAVFLIICITLSTHLVKVIEVNSVWQIQTASTHKMIQVFNKIKPRSSVRSFNYADFNHMPVPPIQHVASLAAVYRAAFIPHLFGRPNTTSSLVFNPPYDQLSEHVGVWYAGDALSKAAKDKLPLTNEDCKLYDYSIVTFMDEKPKLPDCFEFIDGGKYFALYKRNY